MKLARPDDDAAARGTTPRPAVGIRTDARSLYGEPQHESADARTEQKEAFYGEPQHEDLEEFLGGEPFPWLLDTATDERPREKLPTRAGSELPLRRLGRDRSTTRRR